MRWFWTAILAAVAAGGTGAAADAPSAPAVESAKPAHTQKIGYLDFTRVWNEYHRSGDAEKELNAHKAQLGEQDRIRVEDLTRRGKQIEGLALGTPERLDLEEKQKAAMRDLDEFRQKSREELNKRLVSLLQRMFNDVVQEVAAAAKEGNYDLVVKEQTADPKVTDSRDAALQLSQRVVLYAKPEYDLTGVVIQRLNDKYDAEKKQRDSAPASPKQPETPTREKEK